MLLKVKIIIGFPAESPGEGGKFYYINSKGKNYKERLNSTPPQQQVPWRKEAQKL
jgi:hypothetical protein